MVQGQVLVGGAAVLEATVEAKNGRLYVLNGVLIPPSITPVLPHRCDVTETKIVKVRVPAPASRLASQLAQRLQESCC